MQYLNTDCPHCGLMMTWYGTRLPESFLEEENYG